MAFDAQAYLAANPDVAAAGMDPLEHYNKYGKFEGRTPTGAAPDPANVFNEQAYLAANPDVAEAVQQGVYRTGLDHFIQYGSSEGRAPTGTTTAQPASGGVTPMPSPPPVSPINNPSPFNEQAYLAANPDVAEAVRQGIYPNAMAHYEQYGKFEGRNPSGGAPNPATLFNEQAYLAANPDVAEAVQQGVYRTALDHFIQYGSSEGRDPTGGTAGATGAQSSSEEASRSSSTTSSSSNVPPAASGPNPYEAISGAITVGSPEYGQVNVVDYMGLQAGQPTLPQGTAIASQVEDIQITPDTIQALTPEATLETGQTYVTEPSGITASTVTSPTAKDAVTAVANTTDLVNQPDVAKTTAEKSYAQINAEADALQAARLELADVDPKATVQGQLALLSAQFEDGNIPIWAQGAMRTATGLMAQRGLAGSSIAAEAITNALMQSTIPIAQQDASFFQNVTIQNLSNEQQAEMERFNSRVSAIFNDQAADNAANNLNTTEENRLSQFFAELSQNVALTNTSETNAMEQFNATAQNQMTQFFEELDLTAETFNADAINDLAKFDSEQVNIVRQFNAELENQRQQFNAKNQLAIDASNVNWRRDVNTANTANTNAAIQMDAQNLLDVQMTSLNNIWQHYDTLLNYAFQAEENERDRNFQLMLTTMTNELQQKIQEDSGTMDLIGVGVNAAARIIASPSGSDWFTSFL